MTQDWHFTKVNPATKKSGSTKKIKRQLIKINKRQAPVICVDASQLVMAIQI